MSKRAKERPPARAAPRLQDLVADPSNRRRHTARNIAQIVASLEQTGAARSIVIDEDNVVLAGNGVREAADQAGITKLRVIEGEADELIAIRRRGLNPAQKRFLSIADNRSAELAEWNIEQLRTDLEQGQGLAPFFHEAELEALLAPTKAEQQAAVKAGKTGPDDVPAGRATGIVSGDLFTLGRHRLLCGDATRAPDVGRLLGNVTPVLMVTDPPYGVAYDPKWRAEAGINKNTKKLGQVTNDGRSEWSAAWRLFPGPVAYVWHGGLKAQSVQGSLEQAGFTMRAQIIWAKDRLVIGRGDYHWQHEPCWYAVREGAQGQRTKDRTQTTLWRITAGVASTVWEIPSRDDSGHTHGTQKPVECMARPMKNHQAPTVYDPFLGSGTSLIAAEMLSRTCYALEIEPRYVQVAIDRWEAFTGQKAKKVAGG